MSFDPRTVAYPLEALHKQESWRLERLQSELAAASRRVTESLERHEQLQREHGALSKSVSPTRADIIDPDLAARRLLYLRDLQQRAKTAAQAVLALEGARDGLQAQSLKQRVRYESIDEHRRNHFRDEAARSERQQGVEADREWLAGANWRRRSREVDSGPVEAHAAKRSGGLA